MSPEEPPSISQENDTFINSFPPDPECIDGNFFIRVPDSQTAQNRKLGRDAQLATKHIGIPRHRHLDARIEMSFREGQQERLQIHAHAQRVGRPEILMHADDGHERRAEELEVANLRRGAGDEVVARDPEPLAVHLGAQLGAEVTERFGQRRDVGFPAPGFGHEGGFQAVQRRPGHEDQAPRLDVGVGWRVLGELEGFVDERFGHRFGEEAPRGVSFQYHLVEGLHLRGLFFSC